MGVIHVLDKSVAELIAAGEVVERPASIVKELLENAIDAGATAVTVEIKGGGIGFIRIADNGCGILREDIPKAFLRHATSKVKDAEDLDSILTLGFRGEALASIAAMCRVELTTKTEEEMEGTTYRVEGGTFIESAAAGCPTGTTITVRDIFFNTPARMKFLKRDISEGNAVAQVVDKCALSHPEVSFRFVRDGQIKLRTSGNGDLLAVILAIYSRDFAGEMIPVDYNMADTGMRVTGFVSKPSGSKPSRAYQNFFINGRYVRSRTCSAALEEAGKTKIMVGKFPACVLNLHVDPHWVDVNVHPAKIEVRFVNEKPVFNAVYFAVKSALSTMEIPVTTSPAVKSEINELTLKTPQKEYTQERLTAKEFQELFQAKPDKTVLPPKEEKTFSRPVSLGSANLDIYVEEEPPGNKFAFSPRSTQKQQQESGILLQEPPAKDISGEEREKSLSLPGSEKAPASEVREKQPLSPPHQEEEGAEYRLVGEVFGTYILLEQEGELVLVDKHAAHERMLYEELKENLSYGNRQVLLSPISLTLAREEYDALLAGRETVEQMGFTVEDFGGGTLLVREVPVELGERDVAYLLGEIAHKLCRGSMDITPTALDKLYYSIACKSAIRAGDKNSPAELNEIVKRLEKNPQITHCPHGRPVSVRLSRGQVEKMFGRLG